jgi:hypothetical protein
MEFISFIIYFIFIHLTNQNITFNFKINNNISISNSSEYIKNLLNIDLITELKVGTPIQKLNCNIQSQQFIYYISDENDTRIYNSSNSSSFDNKSSSIIQFLEGPIEKGLIANETYNFDLISKSNISVEKFNIILSKEHKVGKEIKSCSIGIGNREFLSSDDKRNLIFNLYDKKLIENISFYFNFNGNNKNELIIGGNPHILEKEKFNTHTFKIIKSIEKRNSKWYTQFNISLGKNNISEHHFDTSFNPNLNGIISPSGFFQRKINDTIFSKFIIEKKCIEDSYLNYYIFYHCEKDTKLNFENLENIYFENKELNYTFEIEHKKLFEEYNNRLYYLVIFGGETIIEWTLGKPFLENYTTVFTFDKIESYIQSNTIGFEIPLNNKNNNKSYIIWIILAILFCFIIIIVVYVICKKCNNKNDLDNDATLPFNVEE